MMKKTRMYYGTNLMAFRNAKELRNRLTEAESFLNELLKKQFPKIRFRKQHPIGPYIADFYAHKLKLVIEVDGSIHRNPEVLANDLEKDSFYRENELTVLRCSNEDVFNGSEIILGQIKHIVEQNFPLQGD